MNWHQLQEMYGDPLFGVSITVLAYAVSMLLHRQWRWLHPLLPTCGGLIALLLAMDIPLESYRKGADLISFFLGPATIALGVPLYKQAQRIRQSLHVLLIAITLGALAGLASAGVLVWIVGGSRQVMLSMLPRSVTTPISMALSKQLGGTPQLTAVFTVLSGLLGSVIGPRLLRLCGVQTDLAIGAAIGTAAHGIGTARIIRDNELQGSVSGLAMASAGIITSLLTMPVVEWLSR